MKPTWRNLLSLGGPPLALLIVILLGWHAAIVWWEIPAYLLPPAAKVWQAAVTRRWDLLRATAMTTAGALCGFAASLIVGIALGLLFSASAWIRRAAYPYAIFLQTVPIVAIAPIIVTMFGAGFGSVVLVAFIISLFPIITNATAGLTSVNANLLELFAMHNATRTQTLLKLRLPHAVPYLVTGAKISCGLSVIGAIVGEFFAGYGAQSYGLGYLITFAKNLLKTDDLFAAVLCSTLLGVTIFGVVNLIGATILARWHTAEPRRFK